MEISRDGRRVPELIDTSAPRSGCAGYTTHKLAGEQEKRVGKRERERDIYGSWNARIGLAYRGPRVCSYHA